MEEIDLKRLCLNMAKAESEEDIQKILVYSNLWDDEKCWKYFGGKENNFSTIGNQQSDPSDALVEKLINSIDAVLTGEILSKGIDPEGKEAPSSMYSAVEQIFGVKNGDLSELDQKKLRELSDFVSLIATGDKSKPNYIIIDKGEGQTANKFETTFLSIGNSNKMKIPFVQGKFNMGGTGVLRFCGDKKLQLIISKRNPKIKCEDETKDYWAYTIVRREDPKNNEKSSVYKYLVIDNKIPKFKEDKLMLAPDIENSQSVKLYSKVMEYGTFIKLYNYNIKGYTSAIRTGLYYNMNWKIPKPPIPISLIEGRKYEGRTVVSRIDGVEVKLTNKAGGTLEEDFPIKISETINGEKIKIEIYAFERNKNNESIARDHREKEGVLFTINGQTHGALDERFFTRKNVGLDYVKEDLLVIVNCSEISPKLREDLFMNSRDRLGEGEVKDNIIKRLEEILRNSEELNILKEKRRAEKLKERLDNNKLIAEKLELLMKNNPQLDQLLRFGDIVNNNKNNSKEEPKEKDNKNFIGKEFPSKFDTKRKKKMLGLVKEKVLVKEIQEKTETFKVLFETDAENNYLTRGNKPGVFKLFYNDTEVDNYGIKFKNGIAELRVTAEKSFEVNNIYEYTYVLDNYYKEGYKFSGNFLLSITENKQQEKPEVEPKEDKQKENGNKNNKLNLPDIREVYKEDWSLNEMDEYSALHVVYNGLDGYDFYINMDNQYLVEELKNAKNEDEINMKKEEYKIGMFLYGLVNIKEWESYGSELFENAEISEMIKYMSRSYAKAFFVIQGIGKIA